MVFLSGPKRGTSALRILWGLLVASIVIPGLLLGLAAWQGRERALEDASDASARLTDILHGQVQNVFETFELIMDRLQDDVIDVSDREVRNSRVLQTTMQSIVGAYNQIGSIWIFDASGRPLANTMGLASPTIDVSGSDYMRAFQSGATGTFVSRRTKGQLTGRQLVNLARPLRDGSGRLRGAIVISAHADYFRDRFARAAPELDYSAAIVASDGAVLVRDARASKQSDEPRATPAFLDAISKASFGQYNAVSANDGTERVVSFRKLDKYPVYVMFRLGTQSVLASWRRQVGMFGLFAFAAMIGLVSMSAVALARTRRAELAVKGLVEETNLRKRTEAKLVTAQRMEALGQLTGGIAHDFNNLLAVVMGNLDLLSRAKEERRPRLIENALHAVEQGRRLTQQLLAFGRRQNLRPEVVDVNQLIRGMTGLLTQSLRGDIRLDLDLCETIWPVEVDPVELQTALINLAVNARDAMPRGGTLVLRTTNMAEGGKQGVSINVSDTGGGMPSDVLERAFEPFFTTKDIGRGSGLGLSQVVGFIEQSGGSVDIASEVGRGTNVTLSLPRAQAALKADSPAESAPNGPSVQNLRGAVILLVEDNPQLRELATAILTDDGHVVVEARNARQALDILHDDRRIEFMFSDLVMPGDLDGLDLAREVRKTMPHIPIVLATGYSEAAAKVVSEGFPLVAKPYRPETLTTTVRQVLSDHDVRRADNVIPIKG